MGISINHQAVLDLADSAGGIDVRPAYSGRGMFGSSCLGVVGSASEFASFIATVVEEAVEFPEDEALQALRNEIEDPSTDSMGLETIWYWPRIKVSNIIPEDEHAWV